MKLENTIITGEKYPFEKFWHKVPKLFKLFLSWIEALVSCINYFKKPREK